MATRHTSAPAVLRNSDLDSEAVRAARIDLAACFRMAARLGLHEGICNHCDALSDSGLARPAALMQLAT
jgi:hypothetical protein